MTAPLIGQIAEMGEAMPSSALSIRKVYTKQSQVNIGKRQIISLKRERTRRHTPER